MTLRQRARLAGLHFLIGWATMRLYVALWQRRRLRAHARVREIAALERMLRR